MAVEAVAGMHRQAYLNANEQAENIRKKQPEEEKEGLAANNNPAKLVAEQDTVSLSSDALALAAKAEEAPALEQQGAEVEVEIAVDKVQAAGETES